MQTPSTRWTTHAQTSSGRSCRCVISTLSQIHASFEAIHFVVAGPFNTLNEYRNINERCPCLSWYCRQECLHVLFGQSLSAIPTKKMAIEIFSCTTDLTRGLHWHAGRFRFGEQKLFFLVVVAAAASMNNCCPCRFCYRMFMQHWPRLSRRFKIHNLKKKIIIIILLNYLPKQILDRPSWLRLIDFFSFGRELGYVPNGLCR